MTTPDLMRLHELLAEYEEHLARKTVPAEWSADGIEEIHYLQGLIENEA